jgi:hypothetical protein
MTPDTLEDLLNSLEGLEVDDNKARVRAVTADQYRTAIGRLGLTQAQTAAFMGISIRTSHGYANGETIPRVVELLLTLMLRWDIKPSELLGYQNCPDR